MARAIRRWGAIGMSLVALGCAGVTQANVVEPISYRVAFPDAVHHYAEVTAEVPTEGHAELTLFLPVWTPGSYMVREYARNLENVQVSDETGAPCPVNKVSKNRWHLATHGGKTIHLRYRVYCREMTVRSNWVDEHFALLNGAATYMSVVGASQRPYSVTVQLPSGWHEALSGMPQSGSALEPTFSASDYDQLVDSPIVAGSPAVYRFDVLGTKHVLVNQGEDPKLWDGARSARDVARICAAAHDLWGDFPYAHVSPDSYTFFNLLTGPGGGLEHKNSTVMMDSRFAMRLRKDYIGWLSLVAHEYFHCWNVKRLRPVALGPFDYENENYTPNLWIAEGFTEYYGELLVRRASLTSQAEYLKELSHNIEVLQTAPGRKVQPLSSASYDAWIKFYRPDENSPNTAISYYSKGSLVGFLLDAEIRSATGERKSLDDVMRLAYSRYSGERGYTDAQFRALASEVAGHSLEAFFARAVDSTEELDYTGAMRYYGLRFKPEEKKEQKADPEPGFLGLTWANKSGRIEVTGVRRETPAYAAGLQVDDEIVAVDDYRVLPEKFDDRFKLYPANTTVSLLIARGEQMLRVPVKLGKKPPSTWELQVDPAAAPEARHHLELWLGKESAATAAHKSEN